MTRSNSKNIKVKTGNEALEVKSDGVIVESDVKKINFINATVVNQGNKEINVTVDNLEYDIVNNIPSYLIPDGKTVLDNGNGTYSILRYLNDTVLLSYFDAVDDLEYFNVITDGTTSTILYAGFDQTYVGKKIRIKQAHQNPNTANGNEAPNTTLGRIVTVSATITAVTDGVSATIDFVPNKAGTLRAYCFTNNAEAIHRAIRFCQYRNIQHIQANFSGTLGFDFYDKGIYSAETTKGIDIHLSVSGLKITTLGAKFKATGEFTNGTSFFNLLTGNNDFYLDIPILPADRFARDPQYNSNVIVAINNASNSVRNITIKNQHFTKDDLDGNDGFWNKVIESDSTGGSYTLATGRKSQKIFIENCSARCKNGSYTLFQGIGYSKEVYMKDVFLNDEQHFEGERGREFASSSADSPMSWQYNNGNFSVSGNVVTTTEEDFSFYDCKPSGISITVTINGQSATIASITDAKTAVLNAGISDVANQNCTIGITGRDYFDHSMYAHPSIILHMVRCKNRALQFGKTKMYSDSGNVEDEIGEWHITDCNEGLYNLETKSGGVTSTATVTKISNSKVSFYGMSGYCTVKNSEVSGSFIGKSFLTEGGNTYNMITSSYVTDDNLEWISIGEKGNCPIRFYGSNAYVFVQAHQLGENELLPMAQNGTMVYKDIRMKPNSKMAQMTAGAVTGNTTIVLENFKMDKIHSYSLFSHINYNTAQFDFKNSRFYANHFDESYISFNKSFKNVASITVINEHNNYYAERVSPNFNQWQFYKEFDYVLMNFMDSNFFIVQDFNFSAVVACALPIISKTNTGISLTEKEYTRNMLPMFRGTIKVLFKGSCATNPYNHRNGAGDFNSSLREHATLSNLAVKNVERQDGEIVEFYIDSKNNRLIEISSTVLKHYVSTKPTRPGVENEKVYLNDKSGIYFENEMTFTNDAGNSYAGTQSNVDEKDDSNVTTQTNTHIDLTDMPEFSIGQEKNDGSDLVDFGFTLNINGGGTLEFEYQNTWGSEVYHPDFSKYLWEFKSSDGAGYRCFINNRTGQVVFDGTIAETLDTANILTVNSGYKITGRNWVKRSENATEVEDTGAVLDLFNDKGHLANMNTANASASFVTENLVINGFQKTKINRATKPIVYMPDGSTLADEEPGTTFVANTDMYLVTYYNGITVKYYFINI